MMTIKKGKYTSHALQLSWRKKLGARAFNLMTIPQMI